jgi:hypothetical protein
MTLAEAVEAAVGIVESKLNTAAQGNAIGS